MPGTYVSSRSSTPSFPRSASSKIAAAVNCFVTDPTAKRVCGVTATLRATSAKPKPLA
jgi:hypothetical protein